MRKRYTHIIIALLFFSIKCWAQLDIGMQNSQPVVPSWENYELMQYGKIGASMYTGTVNYSIPIYTYKDKDFEIPISIDYATNGLRVNHSSGILGHGWSLYTPGVITRKVRGFPDEKTVIIDNYLMGEDEFLGYSNLIPGWEYQYGIQYRADNKKAYTYKKRPGGNHTYNYDAESDIYTFNFFGYTGSFQRRTNNHVSDGQVFRIIEATSKSRGLKITIPSTDVQSYIYITDSDGYQYVFEKCEFYEMVVTPHANGTAEIPTSWVLTSVTSPNNRSVHFVYDWFPHVTSMQLNGVQRNYHPRQNYYYAVSTDFLLFQDDNVALMDSSRTGIAKLVRIEFDDSTNVTFNYDIGKREWRYRYPNTSTPAVCDNTRLTDIEVRRGAEIIKTCHLSYVSNVEAASHSSNCATFLNKVDISGEGSYTFDYNGQDDSYPFLGTPKCDHWGFYNNKGFPLYADSLFECIEYGDDVTHDPYAERVLGNRKDPSFTHSLRGTLRKITYPTGGFSLLDYEPHTYSREVARDITTSGNPDVPMAVAFYQPELMCCDTTLEAGGVRIRRIINHLADGVPEDTTSYTYKYEADTTMSSGILINTPRYGVKYNDVSGHKFVTYFNLANFMYDYDRTHIEYSDVTVSNSGKGHQRYHYSTSEDYVDVDETGGNGVRINLITIGNTQSYPFNVCYETDPIVEQLLTPIPSRQYMRGKLVREEQFDDNGQLKYEVLNTYSITDEGMDTVFRICGEIAKELYCSRHNIELVSTTTTEYNNNTAVSKTEQYEYNRIGLPTVVKTSTSLGDTVVTRNTYVVDTVASTPSLNDQTIIDMADKHLLGKLLSSQTHRVSGTAEKLLSAARLTYYKPDPNKTKLFCPSTKQEWVSGDNWKTVEQYQFDAMGNLVEIVDESALANSYLWSYGSRHMVSTLQNATKSQTETALASVGLHSVDSLARMTNLTSADFGKVKNLGQQLLSSLQDAWRYRPLVGMTESAPPNHAGATYHYDGYGRLTEIRDDMGKVVGQQEYNIVSVLPMTSTMHRDSLRLNEGVVAASVTAQGGSGSYSYQWQLADSTGAVLQTGTGSQMSQNLLPGNYTITFTVADLVSGESATHTWLASVPVRFKNIRSPEPEVKGWTTVLADITLGDAANLAFTVDYAAPVAPSIPNTFKVTIGNQTYNYSGTGLTGIQRWFAAGTTTVSISMYNASQGDATLTLTSAGNLAIGSPDILTFEMGSD